MFQFRENFNYFFISFNIFNFLQRTFSFSQYFMQDFHFLKIKAFPIDSFAIIQIGREKNQYLPTSHKYSIFFSFRIIDRKSCVISSVFSNFSLKDSIAASFIS